MALIRHRNGRCSTVMGTAPFHTCMNASCAKLDVDGNTFPVCRVHAKKADAGKSLTLWTGVQSRDENNRGVYETVQVN